MITPLDEYFYDLHMQVKMPEVYVDDATATVVARRCLIEDLIVRAARGLVAAFEQGAGLPVSKTKGQVTCSDNKISKGISRRLKRLGMRATRKMTVLGVNIAAGKGGLHAGQRIRFNAMHKKNYRIAKLKRARADVQNVTRAELVLGTAYGSRVIGVAPVTLVTLHRLRSTMVLAIPKRAKSASLTLQYLASDTPYLDPSFGVAEAPLLYWAYLAFDGGGETHHLMQMAWQRRAPRLGRVKRPCQHLAGPAGATTLTLKRIGWRAFSAFHWGTETGTNFDLRKFAPSAVRKLIRVVVEKSRWAELAAAPSTSNDTFTRQGCWYWMADIRRLCRVAQVETGAPCRLRA